MRAMVVLLSWVGADEDGTATPDVTSRAWAPCRAPTRAREWRGAGGPSSEPAAALTEQHHPERGAVGAECVLEPGEDLLLARERQAGAARGRAQRADLPRDGQPTLHQLDDLGVTGVDLGAELTDARCGFGVGGVSGEGGGGGGCRGAHRNCSSG